MSWTAHRTPHVTGTAVVRIVRHAPSLPGRKEENAFDWLFCCCVVHSAQEVTAQCTHAYCSDQGGLIQF
jgi:hypothetical protein